MLARARVQKHSINTLAHQHILSCQRMRQHAHSRVCSVPLSQPHEQAPRRCRSYITHSRAQDYCASSILAIWGPKFPVLCHGKNATWKVHCVLAYDVHCKHCYCTSQTFLLTYRNTPLFVCEHKRQYVSIFVTVIHVKQECLLLTTPIRQFEDSSKRIYKI